MNSVVDGKCVLLVEDERMAQMAARIMLQECDLEVDTVDSGQEAVEAATTNEYLVIFMDYGLPGFNGDIATKKIREAGIKTPIVGLTANNDEQVEEDCKAAGMNLFLQKPITVDDVNNVLSNIL